MNKLIGSKRWVSLLALMLSIVMLLTACGGSETPDASSDAAVSGEATGDGTGADAENDATTSDSTTETASNASKQQTGNKTDKPSSKKPTGTTTTSGKTVFDKNIYGNIPDSVVKKGIHLLMWRKLHGTELQAVEGFEKKTGMKVRVTVTTQADYQTKLVSLISGKDSPDVVVISPINFPAAITKSCIPLDPKVFRLDDDCWYKPYMDEYQINGKYYSVAMNKIWNCEDTNYVTYYLKSALKQANVTTTPYELYKQGKWDWAAQKQIAMKCKNAGIGGMSFTYEDAMMYSAGSRFVKYNGKQFSSNMDDPTLAKAWRELASLREDGAVNSAYDLTGFQQGKVGLFVGIAYNMWKESEAMTLCKGGAKNAEAVPVAGPTQSSAYVPVRTKTWGVAKGAKNPEGAAYFLRYFLDVNNINFDEDFLHDQFRTVFNIITDKKAKKASASDQGIVAYVDKKAYTSLTWKLGQSTSAQIQTNINSQKALVDNSIKQANKDLKRVK